MLESFTKAPWGLMVEAMDTPFLTIAECVDKTGRSPSTIRRVIRMIADVEKHEDRDGISPAPKEVDALKKKGENFTWKIREDILHKHLKTAPKEEKKSSSTLSSDLMQILQRELELKNQQIEKQWDVIQSLNDRLREGNILMGSLQKRLSLPTNESPAQVPVEVAASGSSAGGSAQSSTEAAVKAAKRNFLRRMFGG